MELRVVAVFITLLWHSSGSCPNGSYGYRCGYECHCPQKKCDHTSGCQSSDCFEGWSGPTCQRQNVSQHKITASSGDVYNSSRATDGDYETDGFGYCIETSESHPNWWRVDLKETVLILLVNIYFRTDYTPRRNGIQVYITNSTDTPSGDNCYNVTGSRDGHDIDNITRAPCSGRGRYILLYTTVSNDKHQPKMDFCEVDVNVCGPGTFGADCENYCHCDGEVCNYVSGVCPSGECLPGWRNYSCNTECHGKTYGKNCSKVCTHRLCKDTNLTCNHVTGECLGGCMAGYEKPDCTKKCLSTYGEYCSRSCSARHCSDTSPSRCHHVTGECEGGCSPGWKGVDCTAGCLQNVEYGAGCIRNCSTRMCNEGQGTCPQDTGRCQDGCQLGWEGIDCIHMTVSSPQSGESDGAMIGGIIGGVLAVVVVVLAVIALMFYRRKNKPNNINNGHSIYEDISAMEPEGHQIRASQGMKREGEEEEEEEADRSSYYNIKAPVIVTEVAVDKLGDRIRELQAGEGGFEQEFKVELQFIFQYPRTHGINIKSGYQVACHNTTA